MNGSRALPVELEERLARYRAGAMDAAERAAFEREALANEALADALYTEVSLDALGREAAPAAALPRTARVTPLRPRRAWSAFGGARLLVPLAAGVIAVSAIALWVSRPHEPQPGGEWVRGESAMTALEPSGALSAPPERFRWTRDAGAASYRVELFDTGGNDAGSAISRDTVLAAGSGTLKRLVAGEWRVVAIGPDGLDRPARARASFHVEAR